MNCKQCRSLFSDFIEKAMTPILEREMAAHLRGCPSCRAEASDFRRALVVLHSTPRPDVPPDLAAAISARLAEGAPASPVRGSDGPPRSALAPWLAAAAALLILLPLLGCIWTNGREWKARASGLEQAIADLGEEAASIGQKLEGSRRELERQRLEAGKQTAAAAARSADLEKEVLRLDALRRGQEAEIAGLGQALEAARREIVLRAGEAVRAQEIAAVPPPGPAETAPPVARPRIRPGAEESAAEARVAFRDRGDGLELEVRGPRERVVPELLAIAADLSSPEMASLALGALEGILGRPGGNATPAGEPAARTGLRGWWSRGMQGIAGAVGMEEGEPEAEPDDAARHRGRLKALEEAWRVLSSREIP